jgi:O-antigen/teichoic acid export membrane protein
VTTIFKGLGLFTIDSIGKIIVSLGLIVLILFSNNLDTYYYILVPYLLGALYLLYAFRFKVNTFFKKTISVVNIGIYNIKTGFTLYLTNSLLIAFSLMDRVVFSGVIFIENYGNYLFCYTLSSLHVLTQNQITNKYYRLLLSENQSDNKKKISLILISIFGHIILFSVILFIVNLDIFKSFYSKYKYLNQYIITTELICIFISILSLLYLIINSSKVRMPFLILSYFVPVTVLVLYKLKLIDNFYNWIFVYAFELLIAMYLLFKKKFFYFYTN